MTELVIYSDVISLYFPFIPGHAFHLQLVFFIFPVTSIVIWQYINKDWEWPIKYSKVTFFGPQLKKKEI